MRCPLCSAAAKDGAEECPSCGVLFAKLREKRERDKKKAQAALEAPACAPPPARDPRKLRLAASAIVAAWMIGLALYYAACAPRPRHRAAVDLRGVEVHRSPASPRLEPPPAPGDAPPPPGLPAPDPDFDD